MKMRRQRYGIIISNKVDGQRAMDSFQIDLKNLFEERILELRILGALNDQAGLTMAVDVTVDGDLSDGEFISKVPQLQSELYNVVSVLLLTDSQHLSHEEYYVIKSPY